MGLRTRIQLARLCLITDTCGGGQAWSEFASAMFRAGVDLMTILDPSATAEEIVAATIEGKKLAVHSRKTLGVNEPVPSGSRPDVIQLASEDPLPGPGIGHEYTLVGRHVHTPAEIDQVIADDNIFFFTVGPVFSTRSGGGLDLVRYAAEQAPVADPSSKAWFATGGMTLDRLDEVLAAGARRVAVSRAISRAEDPATSAREWYNRLRAAWKADPNLGPFTMAVLRNQH
jgi:thiamine-phosphate pyrophosphorylase